VVGYIYKTHFLYVVGTLPVRSSNDSNNICIALSNRGVMLYKLLISCNDRSSNKHHNMNNSGNRK